MKLNELDAPETGNAKFGWIDNLIEGSTTEAAGGARVLGKFDRLATSKRWGKWIAAALIRMES